MTNSRWAAANIQLEADNWFYLWNFWLISTKQRKIIVKRDDLNISPELNSELDIISHTDVYAHRAPRWFESVDETWREE